MKTVITFINTWPHYMDHVVWFVNYTWPYLGFVLMGLSTIGAVWVTFKLFEREDNEKLDNRS